MASGEIIIKGGFVIDPTRKIDGDVGDVAIKDGKIVEKVSSSAKVTNLGPGGLTAVWNPANGLLRGTVKLPAGATP